MKLRVTYNRPQDLVRDYEGQFTRGGLLVRVAGVNLAPNSPVELELVTPFGVVSLEATVFQVLAGAGVAVGFEVSRLPGLDAVLQNARAAGAVEGGADPLHELISGEAGPDSATRGRQAGRRRSSGGAAAAQLTDIRTRIREASPAERIQIALHGGKDERNLIIRGNNQQLHKYVLRNPQIQLDEVAAIARMPTVSVEILKFIAERREWVQRPEVAIALVRNPKTPVPLAVKAVDYCAPSELRQLAKASNVRGPIQRAIRRKVVG